MVVSEEEHVAVLQALKRLFWQFLQQSFHAAA